MGAVMTLEVPEIPMAYRDLALNELAERLRGVYPNLFAEEIAGNAETLLLNMLIEAAELAEAARVGVVALNKVSFVNGEDAATVSTQLHADDRRRMVRCFTHIVGEHKSGISFETAEAIAAHIAKTN